MYKIAILGCENSHANTCLNFLRDGKHPDITVAGVYSDDAVASQKLNTEYGVPVMNNYDELVGQVDGIVVTARHGDNHYKYAKPYLPSGIPMFIDKPITCDEAEAVEFMREAKKHGVRLCGGSCCKYIPLVEEYAKAVKDGAIGTIRGGNLCAPLDMVNQYGNLFFYSQHLVQMMVKVFGYDVEEVSAIRCDKELGIVAKYPTFPVTGSYTSEGWYYFINVYGGKGKLSGEGQFGPAFEIEFNDMCDLLHGGEMKETYDEFIRPVFILNAINRAMESGKTEKVNVVPV